MCLHTLHQKLSLQEHFFCRPLESNVSAHSNSNSLTFLTLNNYFLTFHRGYFLSSAILCTLPCGNDGGWNLAVSWLGTWVQLLLIISMCSIPTHLYMEYFTFHNSVIRHAGTLLPKVKCLVTVNCCTLSPMGYSEGTWIEKGLACGQRELLRFTIMISTPGLVWVRG